MIDKKEENQYSSKILNQNCLVLKFALGRQTTATEFC